MIAMNSISTLIVNHFHLYPGNFWYPLWLRLNYFVLDISNLLQAKERTAC
jgi:hypothetical protein